MKPASNSCLSNLASVDLIRMQNTRTLPPKLLLMGSR